jgi:hypothetical protein
MLIAFTSKMTGPLNAARTITLLVLSISALAFSSCGNATASCDFRNAKPQGQGGSNGPEPLCQEWSNFITSAPFAGGCEVAGGTFSNTSCPRENILGGCKNPTAADGSHFVDWHYSGGKLTDESSVKSRCGNLTFLPKP